MAPTMPARLCLLVLFAILLVSSPAGIVSAAEPAEYRIATVAWAGWSPLHVAHEKGLWKRLGIEVEVVDYEDPIVILEAMQAGRIDFAMDMAGTLAGIYMDGAPVVALAETNWSSGGDRIIIKSGHRPRDHLGAPLGVFLNRPSCLYFLHLFLQTRNLRISDYRIVQINPEDMAAHFAVGRLPVIVSYDPWALKTVQEGNGVCLATSADFEGCIPECLWAYKGRLESIPSEDIRKVLQGWIQAVQWIEEPENWTEFRDILNRRTFGKQKPYADEELRGLLAGVKIHTPSELVERNRTEGGLYEYFRSLRAFLEKEELLRRPYRVEDLFDNRFVMEALSLEQAHLPAN